MKKLATLLLFVAVFCFAEEDKHPWYINIEGNKAFSSYQLEEQLDVPEEFGRMDTTKQDFMMRLSLENIKALYYSRGYYSLDLSMESTATSFRRTAPCAATSLKSATANVTDSTESS